MAGAWSVPMPFPGPKKLWRSYNTSLERRPISTKALTSLVGFALGDAVAQFSGRPRRLDASSPPWRYDYYRTFRLATYGGAVAGPLGHFWFGFLDSKVFPHIPKRYQDPGFVLANLLFAPSIDTLLIYAIDCPQAIISKIVVDQIVMTPVGSALFYSAAKLMDLQPQAIVPTLKEKLVPTMKASIKLWPLAHAVNFAFIPSSQRLLYINVISIFWTMLLSQQAAVSEGPNTVEAVMSSPPQLVVIPVLEDAVEVLASASFLDEMEALETEYDRTS